MTSKRRLSAYLRLAIDSVEVEASGKYSIAGVFGRGRGTFQRAQMSGAETSYRRLHRLSSGQLVVSRLKAFEGALAVVPDSLDGWFLSPEFPTFECIEGELEVGYLAHLCRWPDLWAMLSSASKGIGARRERVHVDDFLAMELAIPEVDVQRTISETLDGIVKTTGTVRLLVDQANALAQALAVAATSRFDLTDAEKMSYGWQMRVLADVLAPSVNQTSVQPDGTYRIAGLYSFGKGLIDRGPMRGSDMSYKSLTSLEQGDVVVSKLNGWEGAVAVVDARFADHCVSSEFPTFKVDTTAMLPEFFAGIARAPWFWEALNANARGSMVRRRRISSAEFLATMVWLPPLAVQGRIAAVVDVLDRASIARFAVRTRTDALVPAVLNDAFASLS